jgi:hypothetical protein
LVVLIADAVAFLFVNVVNVAFVVYVVVIVAIVK